MGNGKRASWSGQLSFILAAAASAIGLGNLWRFPYLVAQYGGGTFILIYLLLVVTLGFTLMLSEIAVGRITQQSQLTAYTKLHRKWGFIGLLGTIIPLLIVPYYCVIGGWVLKYFVAYFKMTFMGAPSFGVDLATSQGFFDSFISAPFAPFGYGSIFVIACALVITLGVKNGIEKSNLILMPLLFALAILLSIYVICLPDSGQGLKYYFIPSMDALAGSDGNFSFAQLGRTILGAMGQMFYSLSLAMGIMITYGSYMRKHDSIEKSVRHIEIFDTLIAMIAGLMIVPVVYTFASKTGVSVKEAMNAGPSLMFITLPQVFRTLGAVEPWIGLAFFALVIFAALTSAISLYEAGVASICDAIHVDRKPVTFFTGSLVLFLSTFSALGYGPWRDIKINIGETSMRFLDFFDFIANSVLMPITAVFTCIFIGWVIKPKTIIDEVESNGRRFKTKSFYVFMVKYFAPLLVAAILVSEVCRAFGIGGWKI